jgi:type II secretory pathway pseudopilin PulG
VVATFDNASGRQENEIRVSATGLRRAGGFTYIGVLVIVAIMGVLLATVGEIWHTTRKREKEEELLFVGDQFRRAIGSFYERSPAQARRYPKSLEELLKDPRFPGTRRHLRKIYADPITGGTTWGLVKGPGGEIIGVHSLSEEEPLKKANFSLADAGSEGKKKYSEWIFFHAPGHHAAGRH